MKIIISFFNFFYMKVQSFLIETKASQTLKSSQHEGTIPLFDPSDHWKNHLQ